jgi:hypothetical protein
VKNRTVVGAVATVAVVALVIAGLFAIGSPSTARKFKADQERRNRLGQIHYVLAGQVREEGSLPESLDEIDDEVLRQGGYGFDVRKDPATGELFEYRRLADRRYEVCADFETSSEDGRAQEFGPYPGDLEEHEAGRTCFDRRITNQDVDSAPGFFPGDGVEPFPPKVAPPSSTDRPTAEPPPEPTDAPRLGDPGTRSSSPDPSPSPV